MLNFGRKMTSVGLGGESGGGSAVSEKLSGWRSLLIEVFGASLPRGCISDRKVLCWCIVRQDFHSTVLADRS